MRLLHILHSLRPRLPLPKSFLGFISLQKATEVFSGILFFNKLTGAYGLLAILTGFSLSLIQLSAYLYNLAILILLVVCIPHIRRETPLPNLALAWAYTIDTVINAAYTATFAISWYLAATSAAAAAAAAAAGNATASAGSSSTVAATVVPTATASAAVPTAAVTGAAAIGFRYAARGDATLATESPRASTVPLHGGGGWMSAHEAAASLTVIVIVTVVRFYFCLIVISHTRQALQRYGDRMAEAAAAADGALDDDDDDDDINDGMRGMLANDNGGEGSQNSGSLDRDIDDEEAGFDRSSRGDRRHFRRQRLHPAYPPHPLQQRGSMSPSNNNNGGSSGSSSSIHNPFAAGSPGGEGWKGKLGRTLVALGGQSFWLSRVKDDDWTRDVNSRFRS